MSHPAIQLLQEEFTSTSPTSASSGFLAKKRAAGRIQLVSKAIGPEKTRNEFLQIVNDLILAVREDDEILFEFALQLDHKMINLVGGGSHALTLIPCLELLANVEETMIREKAVDSLAAVVNEVSKAEVCDQFVPMIKRSTEGEWFTSRCSAAGLMPYVFVKSSQTDQEALLEAFGKLSGDETPMVRRQVAKSIQSLLTIALSEFQSKPPLQEHLLNWYRTLTQDAQKSVRVATIENTALVCKGLSDSDVLLQVMPLVRQFASERSWRVRALIAKEAFDLLEFKKSCHESVIPVIIDLLGDSEEEVRVVAIRNLPRAYKSLGRSNFISQILPTLKSLGIQDGEVPLQFRVSISEISLILIEDDPDGALKDGFKPIWDKYLVDTVSNGHAEVRKILIDGLGKLVKSLGSDYTNGGGGGWGRLLRELFESSKIFNQTNSAIGEPQPSEMEEVDTPKWRVRVAIVKNLDVLAKIGITSSGSSTVGSRLSLSSKKPPATDGKEFAIDIWKRALSDEVNDVRSAAAEVLKDFSKQGSGLGGPSAVEQLLVPHLKDFYIKSKSSSFQHRISFLRCCAILKDISSIWSKLEEDFVDAMRNDPVVNVRFAAVRLAANIPPLKSKLSDVASKDDNADIREAAKRIIS